MADKYGTYGDQDMQSRRIPTREESNANPSFLKRLALSMMNNPTAGADPAVMGLVMKNPANVSKLAEIIARDLPEGASPARQAMAYIWAKYPKLARLVGETRIAEMQPGPGAQYTAGRYTAAGNGAPSAIAVNSAATHPDDAVNTFGHELTHAIQDVRSQRVPKEAVYPPQPLQLGKPAQPKPSMSGPGLSRTSVEHGPFGAELGSKTPYEQANDAYGYTRNPYETQARQGGRTAGSGYWDFTGKRAAQLSGDQPGMYDPYLDPFETLINPPK